MSTINSTSTLKQVKAAVEDTASYAEDNDPVKAAGHITALRVLLTRLPQIVSSGTGQSAQRSEYNQDMLLKMIAQAENWLASNRPAKDRSTGVAFADFRNFRT